MPTSKIVAPPIPHTLEFDTHTKPFFASSEHSGPVDTRFKLAVPELQDLVFIGRAARFCTGELHMVAQVVSDDAESGGKGPCLLSALPLPFKAVDARERIQLWRQYLSKHLTYPDAAAKSDWQSRVPTLDDDTFEDGWRRLHFDAGTGLGLDLHASGCTIVDLRDERTARKRADMRPTVDLGDALFDWKAQPNPEREFALKEGAAFHARVEELLRDPDCVLHYSVRFLAMDMEERSRDVFGCGAGEFARAIKLLKLALSIEMGVGGNLSLWSEASWHPWRGDEVVEGRGAGGEKTSAEVPQSLVRWLIEIGEVTGCKVRGDIRHDNVGLHRFARSWAGGFRVSAKKPSAHETIEAMAMLKEMVKPK